MPRRTRSRGRRSRRGGDTIRTPAPDGTQAKMWVAQMGYDTTKGIEMWDTWKNSETPSDRQQLQDWYDNYSDVRELVDSGKVTLPTGEKRERDETDGDGDDEMREQSFSKRQRTGGRRRKSGRKTRRGGRRGRRSTKKMGCW